jgi:hypothetical protein
MQSRLNGGSEVETVRLPPVMMATKSLRLTVREKSPMIESPSESETFTLKTYDVPD